MVTPGASRTRQCCSSGTTLTWCPPSAFATPAAIASPLPLPSAAAAVAAVAAICRLLLLLLLQATASQYAEYAQEFQKAQNEFNMKYHGKKRYGFITPVGIILQMVVFISQFNAISTLANAKVCACKRVCVRERLRLVVQPLCQLACHASAVHA